jgi:hypothetical protein
MLSIRLGKDRGNVGTSPPPPACASSSHSLSLFPPHMIPSSEQKAWIWPCQLLVFQLCFLLWHCWFNSICVLNDYPTILSRAAYPYDMGVFFTSWGPFYAFTMCPSLLREPMIVKYDILECCLLTQNKCQNPIFGVLILQGWIKANWLTT